MTKAKLDKLRIVLVEPAGALNVGAIARVMKNFGLSQLFLVNARCDPMGEEARLMAVHAADVLDQCRQVEHLSQALEGCQQAVATTARDRATRPLYSPEAGLARLLVAPSTEAASALIFGPEDRGLSNEELAYAQCSIRIPTHPGYPSLNLAQAVAVCCYVLSGLAQRLPDPSGADGPAGSPAGSRASSMAGPSDPVVAPALSPLDGAIAPLDEVEGLYQHLETTLLRIGYLYPHTAASRMEKFRDLGHRAQLSSQEVTMLRGILRQIAWYVDPNRRDGSTADELEA
ncbi:MAG: RNA methyltransferase [Elainellaceae cyanobacterium]